MGKTSLLLMLKLWHLSGRVPEATGCRLLKLGPDTLREIEETKDPANTLLLLDSLDEDPEALKSGHDADARIQALLPRVAGFRRCLITCRTQFFPETSGHLAKHGHFIVGPYECALKYLSLFDDGQVELFLRAHFGGRGWKRLWESIRHRGEPPRLRAARHVAGAMENLRVRPLLLSYADDFVGGNGEVLVDFRNRYAVYHRLVDQWLRREETKASGIKADQGWRAAIGLALHLARLEAYSIRREDLEQVPELAAISRFQRESRSLVNRLSKGEFQFAHRTIQEFLVAFAIVEKDQGWDVAGIPVSREAQRFLLQRAPPSGVILVNSGKQVSVPDLRGARVQAAGSAIRWLMRVHGIELSPVRPGEFVTGSPEDEAGRFDWENEQRVQITRGYSLGRFTVTLEQWERVTGRNPSSRKGARLPATNMSWDDAMRFCARLNGEVKASGEWEEGVEFRLPSEAEWEHACRAGTTTAFNDGFQRRFELHGASGSRPGIGSARVVRQEQRGPHALGRRESGQRLGFSRHARECLGVVLGCEPMA